MIISVMNLKGGVGKSTVTQNLAVFFAHSGKKVCIGDTDNEQQTSMKWSSQRDEDRPKIPVFGVTTAKSKSAFTTEDGKTLVANIKALHNDYDVVLLDGTPILSELATWMILASDIVICPIEPSPADIWSLQNVRERFEQVRALGTDIPACILLNKHNISRNLDKEIEASLVQFGMTVLKSRLTYRVSYKEAMIEGVGVFEYRDVKAKEEIKHLAKEIIDIINK
jgi:chromosome partitioning protein